MKTIIILFASGRAEKMRGEKMVADILSEGEVRTLVSAFKSAAERAVAAGFDLIEVQAGHGYLISQFLNGKINQRKDPYGQDRMLFAGEVFTAVREGAPGSPIVVRISGDEMSPDFGISGEDLHPLLRWLESQGVAAVHVGMGHACFSPPWYFHHGSLPDKPQRDAISRLRDQTSLPFIVAGRMGRAERIHEIMGDGLALRY
jgi:2,4-dienoyl-CoA reductase-like NADH-dependent reductase (Old Yellow Enzyme family)